MELISRNINSINLIKKFISKPLTLIDIGCSGGIDNSWYIFADKLISYGFDPVVDEIKRLKSNKRSDNEHYIEAFVHGDGTKKPPLVDFWQRLAMVISNDIIQKKRTIFSSLKESLDHNYWNKLKTSENQIYLPDFVKQNSIEPTFIKIDVDGADFDILSSLEEVLAHPEMLGVCIEVNYNGGHTAEVNTFHNVDRFLRKAGFQLFDFTKRKYSMAALPVPYIISIPAQSSHGRPLQGDAVYFKDLIELDKQHDVTVTRDLVLKQAALLSLFNQKDSCAELLIHFKELLPIELQLKNVLDQLVNEVGVAEFSGLTYDKVIQLFKKNDKKFYPS